VFHKALEIVAKPHILRNRLVVSSGLILLWALVFGVAHGLSPLYASNQNAHLVRGLADGGLGLLAEDWFANTTDPFPIFTFAVSLTYRFLHEYFFYFYHLLLAGVYFYSILGIAGAIFKVDSPRLKYFTFIALLILVHTGAFGFITSKTAGINLSAELQTGVGIQYILGYYLQPSQIGVFILLSIYLFLIKRPYWAAILLGVTALLHFAYLLSAISVTLAYLYVAFRQERSFRKPLLIGGLCTVLALPAVAYVYFAFGQTSREVWSESLSIFVNFRVPHHTDYKLWLGPVAYAKTGLVIFALYLVRKTPLFPVLLAPLVIALILTVIQIGSGSDSLATLMPWRMSVFLVPIATAVILAFAVSRAFEIIPQQIYAYERALIVLGIGAIGLLVVIGAASTRNSFAEHQADLSVPLMDFVREAKVSGDQYFIPTDLERFRAYTGVPIFADFKSFPFKDTEVVEWRDRNLAARHFYDPSNDRLCEDADRLSREYGVTHVVLTTGHFDSACSNLTQTYQDDSYRVFRIKP